MDIKELRTAQRILAGTFDSVTEDDGTYFYEAFAEPGTSTGDGYWRVRRTHKDTGAIEWVAEGRAIKQATDLQGLFS